MIMNIKITCMTLISTVYFHIHYPSPWAAAWVEGPSYSGSVAQFPLPPLGGATVQHGCLQASAASRPRPGRCSWRGRAGAPPAPSSSSPARWTPLRSSLLASGWSPSSVLDVGRVPCHEIFGNSGAKTNVQVHDTIWTSIIVTHPRHSNPSTT